MSIIPCQSLQHTEVRTYPRRRRSNLRRTFIGH